MQEENVSQDNNLVALWEQMGASTGSFIGRLIGLSAQYMLEAYRQTVIEPLRQSAGSLNPTQPNSETPGIRETTWREMGQEYGGTIGTSLGMAMDLLINYQKTSANATVPGFKQPPGPGPTPSNDQ